MKKMALLMVIIAICISFVSCDDIELLDSDVLSKYEYELNINFRDTSDKEVFEERLRVLSLNVQQITGANNFYCYVIKSLYAISREHLKALGCNYEATVNAPSGDSVVMPLDILSVRYDGTALSLFVSKDCAERITTAYSTRTLSLMIDDVDTKAHVFLDNDNELCFMMGPEDDTFDLIKAAIAFSNLQLKAEIVMQVV